MTTEESKAPTLKSEVQRAVPFHRLEALRDQWADIARGMEEIHGTSHPPAKAIRLCIGALYRVMHPDQT